MSKQPKDDDLRHYKPPHSDFLVYWTGKDIEEKLVKGKSSEYKDASDSSSTTDETTTKAYLDRLKSILKYGLWMNAPDDEDNFCAEGISGTRPKRPRVCFTELKLSEARAHACRYGRLGLAFKRPFVVERGGMPVHYFPQWADSWLKSVGKPKMDFNNDLLACFLKPMGEGKRIDYTYLQESEWRIVFSECLLQHYASKPDVGKSNDFCSRNDIKIKPEYLLRMDDCKWLALIIYPSIQAQCAAQRDKELRDLLRQKFGLANKPPYESGTAPFEKYTMPTEMHLDDCRNF